MTPSTLLFALAAFSGQPDVVVYDFTSTRCSPCQQMNPIVERLQRQGYPIQKVDIDQNRGLMMQYRVSSIPAFVLVVNGQEVTRVVGSTSEQSLKALFDRVPQPTTAQIKAPDPRGSTAQRTLPSGAGSQNPQVVPFARGTRIATGLSGLERAYLGKPEPFQKPVAQNQPPATPQVELLDRPDRASRTNPSIAQASRTMPSRPDNSVVIRGQAQEELQSPQQPKIDARGATVRLRLSIGDQIKFGTGTIIQSRPGHSVVLTCGHLFEAMTEDSRIEVNVFENDQYKSYLGRLIKAVPHGIDLGLVELKTDHVLPVARLAVAQSIPEINERLYSLGCSRGETPSLQRVDVTAVDSYEGPPNLECTGMPDPGRSGGGLFNAQQELLGVCIRMNPKNERGLYTSLDPIIDLLQRAEMAHLVRGERATTVAYDHQIPEMKTASAAQSRGQEFASAMESFDSSSASQPAGMSSFASASSQQPAVAMSNATAGATMTAGDQQILSTNGVGARLTILIQDPQNPAKTRTVIINSASARLVADLLGEPAPMGASNGTTAQGLSREATIPTSQSATQMQPWMK